APTPARGPRLTDSPHTTPAASPAPATPVAHAPRPAPEAPPGDPPLLRDLFSDDRPRGRVIGTPVPESPGLARGGVDVERIIAIDHGALRIQPPAIHGWGRAGLSYGPFPRRPGLALAVFATNGHNMSQTTELKSWVRQVGRWFRASETDPLPTRVLRWLGHRPRLSLPRKIHRWYRMRQRAEAPVFYRDNFAVGFFLSAIPADPAAEGSAFIIHSSETNDNGELRARAAGSPAILTTGFQNTQVYYIVILRERGAAYYAAALPGARGAGAYPAMRPVAIDAAADDPEVHAGIWQSVIGEIGFTMDTRVHGVTVAHVPALAGPFGGAHVADALTTGSPAARWRVTGADLRRTGEGSTPAGDAVLLSDPGAPTGLLHALVRPPAGAGPLGLAWRAGGPDTHLAFTLAAGDASLQRRERGAAATLATAPVALPPGRPASLMILDDGREVRCFVNGALAFPPTEVPEPGPAPTAVGIIASGASGLIRDFEAHPRALPIPAALDMGPPWHARGRRVLIRDDFRGQRRNLAGHRTAEGNKVWRRDVGLGLFEITGEGAARVAASVGEPCPHRTIYTVEWDNPDLADVEMEMTPPGTARHQNHRCRSGFVFWQDERNHLLINAWVHDGLNTGSISTFLNINGFEDIFDAVWSCTGEQRIRWGHPIQLRAVCDGDNFLVTIDGEPIVHRRITDVYPHLKGLRITRVGLLANWEWGTDTGTMFRGFTGRG
ncbi:MAG: hypothetical protein WD749_11840, partial [Phycisphaerales bacterium]